MFDDDDDDDMVICLFKNESQKKEKFNLENLYVILTLHSLQFTIFNYN